MNNSKTKVDDLDVSILNTVAVKLKNYIVDKQVGKNTNIKMLKTKVSNLEKKMPDAATLIQIRQYNKDKQNLEKKLEMLIN